MEGSALHHQRRFETLKAQVLQYRARHLRVLVVGRELAAPAVEEPLHPADAALAVDQEGRAIVAHPGIVVFKGMGADARPAAAMERDLGHVLRAQRLSRQGHSIQVRLCGAHSGGM